MWAWKRSAPLERLGTRGGVAKVALFLASEEARHFTGEVLHVDGDFSDEELENRLLFSGNNLLYWFGTDVFYEGELELLRFKAELAEESKESIPSGRFGTPEDVSWGVGYLVSDVAGYLTG